MSFTKRGLPSLHIQIWTILLVFNKLKFVNISVNFEGSEMVNHILEFPRLVVYVINCFNWNPNKIMFTWHVVILHWTKTIFKSSLNSHVYWDTLYE